MADDYMFLAHKGASVAIYLAKMGGSNDWTGQGITENWNAFMRFVLDGLEEISPTEEQHDAFWDTYSSKTDDYVLLRENTFHETWTTPSGRLFNSEDYLTKDRALYPQIFQVSFDAELIREHKERHIHGQRPEQGTRVSEPSKGPAGEIPTGNARAAGK
jgi:hypothetical protein